MDIMVATTRATCIALSLGLAACGHLPPERVIGERREPLLTYPEIYGTDFAPGTLALTYDDGPDAYTLPLAQYLHDEGIPATFFIVGCRIEGQPASGSDMCSAPAQFPASVLGRLVALGHRIANHTQHHLSLKSYSNVPRVIHDELAAAQAVLDPFIKDGVYLFRAPYYDWTAADALAARQFPDLDRLQGSYHADIEGGDWSCASTDQGPVPNRTPAECAQMYLDEIHRIGRGMVGFHDRLEFAVGSDYQLRLTKLVVSSLQAEGGNWKFALPGPTRIESPAP